MLVERGAEPHLVRVRSTAAFGLPVRISWVAGAGPVEVRMGARAKDGARQLPAQAARVAFVRRAG